MKALEAGADGQSGCILLRAPGCPVGAGEGPWVPSGGGGGLLGAQWGREGPLGGKGWGGLHGHLVGVVGVAHRTLKFTSCVPTVPRRCFHFQKEWGMWGVGTSR